MVIISDGVFSFVVFTRSRGQRLRDVMRRDVMQCEHGQRDDVGRGTWDVM